MQGWVGGLRDEWVLLAGIRSGVVRDTLPIATPVSPVRPQKQMEDVSSGPAPGPAQPSCEIGGRGRQAVQDNCCEMKPKTQRKEGKGGLLLVSSFRSKHTLGPSKTLTCQ